LFCILLIFRMSILVILVNLLPQVDYPPWFCYSFPLRCCKDTFYSWPDWYLGANSLLQETADALSSDSPGLSEMRNAVERAALSLKDVDWRTFVLTSSTRWKAEDPSVNTSLFSKAEPRWKKFLMLGQDNSCQFLHLGAPPSEALCKQLDDLDWTGVCVGREPIPPDYCDVFKLIKVDHRDPNDEEAFLAIAAPERGAGRALRPRSEPLKFSLVFINSLFDPPGSVETFIGSEDGREDEEDSLSSADAPAGDDTSFAPECEQTSSTNVGLGVAATIDPFAYLVAMPFGYGKIGLTVEGGSSSRCLRVLRNSLLVALRRLQVGGSLVITWIGPPLHPVLFFLTSLLRPVFLHVHVLTPPPGNVPEENAFVVYILCMEHSNEDVEDANQTSQTPGHIPSLRGFCEQLQRTHGIDDTLRWCLSRNKLLDEYFLTYAGRSGAKGYNDLWTEFGKKYGALREALEQEARRRDGPPQKPKKSRGRGGDRASGQVAGPR